MNSIVSTETVINLFDKSLTFKRSLKSNNTPSFAEVELIKLSMSAKYYPQGEILSISTKAETCYQSSSWLKRYREDILTAIKPLLFNKIENNNTDSLNEAILLIAKIWNQNLDLIEQSLPPEDVVSELTKTINV